MAVKLMNQRNQAAVPIQEPAAGIPRKDREVLPVQSGERPFTVRRHSNRWELPGIQQVIMHALIEAVLADEPRRKPDDFGRHQGEVLPNRRACAHGRTRATDTAAGKRQPTIAAVCVIQPARIGRLGEQRRAVGFKGANKPCRRRIGKWIRLKNDVAHIRQEHRPLRFIAPLEIIQIVGKPGAADVLKLGSHPAPAQDVARLRLPGRRHPGGQPAMQRRKMKTSEKAPDKFAPFGQKLGQGMENDTGGLQPGAGVWRQSSVDEENQ